MKKVIFIALILFTFTGCAGDYGTHNNDREEIKKAIEEHPEMENEEVVIWLSSFIITYNDPSLEPTIMLLLFSFLAMLIMSLCTIFRYVVWLFNDMVDNEYLTYWFICLIIVQFIFLNIVNMVPLAIGWTLLCAWGVSKFLIAIDNEYDHEIRDKTITENFYDYARYMKNVKEKINDEKQQIKRLRYGDNKN